VSGSGGGCIASCRLRRSAKHRARLNECDTSVRRPEGRPPRLAKRRREEGEPAVPLAPRATWRIMPGKEVNRQYLWRPERE